MAGFLSSPAAQLLGSGIQAIAMSDRGTPSRFLEGVRSLFKNEEEEKPSPCRTIASRISGVMQVVKPLVELKCLIDEARGHSVSPRCNGSECRRSARDGKKSPAIKHGTIHKYSSERSSKDHKPSSESKRTAPKKVDKKSSCDSDKCEKGRRISSASHRSRKRSRCTDEEEETCSNCPRTKSLKKLPCGRLICSKCDKTGDHDLESNMPRNSRIEKRPNPLAIIDLTQDSPSNIAHRLSRNSSDIIEILPRECEYIESEPISNDKDQKPKQKKPKLSNSVAIVNLDETINLEDSLICSNTPKQKQKSKPMKEGLTCPICLETFTSENIKAMTTPCGHVFCLECLKKITSAKKKCSICQRPISFSKCIRLHI